MGTLFKVIYLITFRCYGTHLHGQAGGSVDREHNCPGTPLAPANERRAAYQRGLMTSPPYFLNSERRPVVLAAIREAAEYKGWRLIAVHIRTTHLHVIVESECDPVRVMNAFKAYASRKLNTMEAAGPRWARHGSTRHLWNTERLQAAIRYVLDEQGEPMAWWASEPRP